MTIGEALEKERISLKMSKYQFSKGIVDRKFYSKVENNQGVLSSKKLLLLLQKNNIDFQQFFSMLKSKETLKVENLDKEMRDAFIKKDIGKCNIVCQKILCLKGEKILKLRAIVATYYLNGKINHLSANLKKEIVKEIYKSKNITKDVSTIQLFSNVMPILTSDQLNMLVLDFLRKIKNMNVKNEIDRKRIAVLLNNYLAACYDKGIDNEVVDQSMNFLMEMQDVHLLIYKEVGRFFFELIKGNKNAAQQIKDNLISWNYKKLADTLKI